LWRCVSVHDKVIDVNDTDDIELDEAEDGMRPDKYDGLAFETGLVDLTNPELADWLLDSPRVIALLPTALTAAARTARREVREKSRLYLLGACPMVEYTKHDVASQNLIRGWLSSYA
jgi:hypothetical protein